MRVEATCRTITETLERLGVDTYRFDMAHSHPRVYVEVRGVEDYISFSSTAPESARKKIAGDVRRKVRELRRQT
jgi:hypothetical protein